MLRRTAVQRGRHSYAFHRIFGTDGAFNFLLFAEHIEDSIVYNFCVIIAGIFTVIWITKLVLEANFPFCRVVRDFSLAPAS